MSANLVGGERFLTKFQFHEGIHPFNTPPSMAGALVTMSWNEAVIAQGRGWGVIVQGRRPHHARPTLRAPGANATRAANHHSNAHATTHAHGTGTPHGMLCADPEAGPGPMPGQR